MLLAPVDLRSYRFRVSTRSVSGERTVYKSPPKTFSGTVVGDPGSVVRLSVTKNGIRGYIRTEENWIFIRPMPTGAAEGEHMVFNETDLEGAVAGSCASVHPSEDASVSGPVSSPATAAAEGDPDVLELAVDADFEYFSIFGAGTVAEIEAIMNEVAGIVEPELGLTIELVHINVWEDNTDPYQSTDPNGLLDELRGHWNTLGNIQRDCVHLLTGKNLDGFTVGIAFVGAVCNLPSAYGLTQNLSLNSLVPVVVAHELGHNLGADHDPDNSATRYIMYPSISGSTIRQYSDQSKTVIDNYLASVSCVLPADGTSPAPNGGGGGGGGGGPVDPLLLMVLASALTYRRARDAHAQP